MDVTVEEKISRLLVDPNFLYLAHQRSRPNLFSTIAASNTEMWHSAFVKWLLDPNSHIGLGDFPLKRFLHTFVKKAEGNLASGIDLTLGEIEDMDLSDLEFETEHTHDRLTTQAGNKARIDIFGQIDACEWVSLRGHPDDDKRKFGIRIILENKVLSREGDNQTPGYYKYAQPNMGDFHYNFFVYLTPYGVQKPQHEAFVVVTYQDLCDGVIKPCLDVPALPQESRFLLEQYLLNLGKPLKRGIPMALTNKEICAKIYEKHHEALDEIFNAVKGEVPSRRSRDGKVRSLSTDIGQLFEKGLIEGTDELFLNFKEKEYTAKIAMTPDTGDVAILYDGKYFTSPSSAAAHIKEGNANGWTSWIVRDGSKNRKGTLADLRDKLTVSELAADPMN